MERKRADKAERKAAQQAEQREKVASRIKAEKEDVSVASALDCVRKSLQTGALSNGRALFFVDALTLSLRRVPPGDSRK